MTGAVVYTCPKNPAQFAAFVKGFNARSVPASAWAWAPDASLHIIGGLQYGALQILRRARSEGAPYVFFDRAYFGGGPGSNRLRVTFGAYQQHWVNDGQLEALPSAYARSRGVTLDRARRGGSRILIVPPSSAVAALFGLHDWLGAITEQVKGWSDAPLDISRKGDKRPLAERFVDCKCVVTYTSNVAVDAVCAGVPVIVAPESACAPLCPGTRGPGALPDRGAWAASLAWGQFTLEEIASGFARAVVMSNPAPRDDRTESAALLQG